MSSQNSPEPHGLRRILVSVFSGVLFGLFLSKSRTPIQESINSISAKTETSDQDNGGNTFPPLAAPVTPTPSGPEKPCKCCHHETPWWKKLLDIGMLLATAGAFGAAVYYASVSKQMWGEMQQQTCIQREAAINAERAWLGLDLAPTVDVLSMEHDKFQAVIQVLGKNFGKGPALKAMLDSRIVTSDVESNIQSSCNLVFPFVGLKPTWAVSSSDDLSKHVWGQTVFPGQPFGSIGPYSGGNVVNPQGKEAYVIGCIVYEDQFSKPHWTKFCYNTGDFAKDVVKDGSAFKHLHLCNANNYTDETEKKTPSCPVTISTK